MGLYDRDYYRDDHRWNNPFARSKVTILFSIILFVLFVIQVATQQTNMVGQVIVDSPLTSYGELQPEKVLTGEIWRLISHGFLHHPWNFLSLIWTVIFLAWLGRQVEDLYGSKEYLAYLLFTTFLGGVIFTIVATLAAVPVTLMGPAAAVTAVLFLFAFHFPRYYISVFFIVNVPIWLVIGVYALIDIALLVNTGNGNGVNVTALPKICVHVVAALFAWMYHTMTWRISNIFAIGKSYSKRKQAKKRGIQLFMPEPEPQPAGSAIANSVPQETHANNSEGFYLDEQLEAKVDAILTKIAESGKESLTETEKSILAKAGEIYKKRKSSH
ncbi:MAG: rhomboid family intramembrane serine protease [Zavarzinella sp.]